MDINVIPMREIGSPEPFYVRNRAEEEFVKIYKDIGLVTQDPISVAWYRFSHGHDIISNEFEFDVDSIVLKSPNL